MSSIPVGQRPLVRTVFFVDGFNVYHSLLAAGRLLPGIQLKWLDLPSLLVSTLPLIDRQARLSAIHYFTAYAHHLQLKDAHKVCRHQAYVRALTARKVVAHLGKFQPRAVWCGACQGYARAYEEKETDVSLACEVLKGGARDCLDVAVLVSGDTDLAPAVRIFKELYPLKRVVFAFPFDRANRELEKLAPGSFSFSKESYVAHQFSPHVTLPSGKTVTKPDSW